MKKRFPKKPFDYGKYIVEYKESKGGLLRFAKEHINTFEKAQEVREKLLKAGYFEPVIKVVG